MFPLTIEINNQYIKQEHSVKYLGNLVESASNLKWKQHIHESNKKISGGVGITSKVRNFLPVDIMIQL